MELAVACPEKATVHLYQPRQPRATLLYHVKALWEERFEKRYGFWRGFVDLVVARYLDFGTREAGFARLRCDDCHTERLLTLSCKQRGICPSCDAKRAATFAAFLKDELLESVGHTLWTLTIPKMLRNTFMHHRELLRDLSRLAYETIKELMIEPSATRRPAPASSPCLRPSAVSSIRTPTSTALLPEEFGMTSSLDSHRLRRYPRRREALHSQSPSLAPGHKDSSPKSVPSCSLRLETPDSPSTLRQSSGPPTPRASNGSRVT